MVQLTGLPTGTVQRIVPPAQSNVAKSVQNVTLPVGLRVWVIVAVKVTGEPKVTGPFGIDNVTTGSTRPGRVITKIGAAALPVYPASLGAATGALSVVLLKTVVAPTGDETCHLTVGVEILRPDMAAPLATCATCAAENVVLPVPVIVKPPIVSLAVVGSAGVIGCHVTNSVSVAADADFENERTKNASSIIEKTKRIVGHPWVDRNLAKNAVGRARQ